MAKTDVRSRSDPQTVATRRGQLEAGREGQRSVRRGRCPAGLLVVGASVRERGVNYARRQQYRRLSRAGWRGSRRRRDSRGDRSCEFACSIPWLLRAPRGARTRPLLAPLAFTCAPESGGSPLGGRGAARARAIAGGGVAASALAAVAGPGRHRLGGDRADRDCGRGRDEDANLRRPPSGSGARAGGVAVTPPAKVGTQRRPGRHVRGSRARRGTGRARRSRGFDRPVDSRRSHRGADEPER